MSPQFVRIAHRVLPKPLWRLGRSVYYGETAPQRRWRRIWLARLEHGAAARRAGSELRAVRYRGEQLLAQPVQHFQASAALAGNAAHVMDALEGAGLHYLVVDAPTYRRRVLAVSADDLSQVLTVLSSVSAPGWYGAWVADDRLQASGPLDGLGGCPRSAQALRVYRAYASPDGIPLAGIELGCDVEFWTIARPEVQPEQTGQLVPAGSWHAPRANRWTEVLLVDELAGAIRTVDGRCRTCLPTAATRHQYDVDFPIDVVYTWVDGSDPEWLRRKTEAVTGAAEPLHELAANPARYVSRDELRYSMRSLDMYADWVRRVYLVTAGQVPGWLALDHPKLQLVSHEELFGDRGRLPTFNSHAIESQLHHLDGLAEHYLYLNDDVFLGRPVRPELFFQSNGTARYFESRRTIGLGPTRSSDIPVTSAAKNNRDLIQKAFDVTVTHKYRHVPHPQLRSVITELEAQFPAEFRTTAAQQFRSPGDLSIASALHHAYGYRIGRASPAMLEYLYTELADPQTVTRLRRLARNRNVDAFCLNDHTGGAEELNLRETLHAFLEAYFPLPSTFERGA